MKLSDFIIEYQDNYYGYAGDEDGKARLQSLQNDYTIEMSYRDLLLSAELIPQEDVLFQLTEINNDREGFTYGILEKYTENKTFPVMITDSSGREIMIKRSGFGEFYEVRSPQQNGWTRVNTYWSDGQIDESYEKKSDNRDPPPDRKGRERKNAR